MRAAGAGDQGEEAAFVTHPGNTDWRGPTALAVEPNHQELDRISRSGAVSRVIDFSTFR